MFLRILLLCCACSLWHVNAVRLDVMRAACAVNPKLSFCDSHLFEKDKVELKELFDEDTTLKPTTTTTPEPIRLENLNLKAAEKELSDWLTAVEKDEPDDDYNDNLESSHRVHSNLEEYCDKYKVNFHHYCHDQRSPELEGVLPQFCETYKSSCVEEAFNPILERKYAQKKKKPAQEKIGQSTISLAVEKPESQVAEGSGKRLFSGTQDEYCKQYQETFQKICQGGILRSQKDTIDFCTSFDQACHSTSSEQSVPATETAASPANKEIEDKGKKMKEEEAVKTVEQHQAPADMPSKQKEGFLQETNSKIQRYAKSKLPASLEDLEDLDDLDDLPSEEGEKKAPKKSEATSRYCEKYYENYNYFCVGEESTNEHEDFCESYRTNCPEKVGSLFYSSFMQYLDNRIDEIN